MKELPATRTRRLVLRPIQEADHPFLYRSHMDPDNRHLWNQEREAQGYERFVEKFLRRIRNRYDLFYVFEKKAGGGPVGFVYDYGFDSVDRVAFICVYTDLSMSGRGLGIEGAVGFMNTLFQEFGVRKLYSEVYGFNRQAIAIAEKTGFEQEGRLRDFRFWNGRFWDQYIFSMTAERFFEWLVRYRAYFLGF